MDNERYTKGGIWGIVFSTMKGNRTKKGIEYMTELGKKGGATTRDKYGSAHFKKIQKKKRKGKTPKEETPTDEEVRRALRHLKT